MVPWSSSLSFSAVCTLAALATISAFSSRHFLMSRFSLSVAVRGKAEGVAVSENERAGEDGGGAGALFDEPLLAL